MAAGAGRGRGRWAASASMAGRVVVGGGTLLAPERMAAIFGLAVSPGSGGSPAGAALPYVARLFGVRAVLMSVLLAGSDGAERRRQLRWGVVVDLIDAAAAAGAGRRGQLSPRAATAATAAALAEAALGLVALAGEPGLSSCAAPPPP